MTDLGVSVFEIWVKKKKAPVAKHSSGSASVLLFPVVMVCRRLSTPVPLLLHMHSTSHMPAFGVNSRFHQPFRKTKKQSHRLSLHVAPLPGSMFFFRHKLACIRVYSVHCTALASLCLYNTLRYVNADAKRSSYSSGYGNTRHG